MARRSKSDRPLGLPRGAVVVRPGKVYLDGIAGEVSRIVGATPHHSDGLDQTFRVTCADCPSWRTEVNRVRPAADGTLYILGSTGPEARLAAHRRSEECRKAQTRTWLKRDGWAALTSVHFREIIVAAGIGVHPTRGGYETWAPHWAIAVLFFVEWRRGLRIHREQVVAFLKWGDSIGSLAREACNTAWPTEGFARLLLATPEMREVELRRALSAAGIDGDDWEAFHG